MIYLDSPYGEKVDENLQASIYDLMLTINNYSVLNKKNIEVLIAGGCIRDWRINNNIKDVDFFISFEESNLLDECDYPSEIKLLLKELEQTKGWKFNKVSSNTEEPKNETLKIKIVQLTKNEYHKELYVYETNYDSEIKFQLIFVPLGLKYENLRDFIDSTFDFDINKGKGFLDLASGKIKFDDSYIRKEIENATLTFNLSNLSKDPWRLKNIPERAARFQNKVNNFYIRIV